MILTATILLLGQRYPNKSNCPTIPRDAGRRYYLCQCSLDWDGGVDGGGRQVNRGRGTSWRGDETTTMRVVKPEDDPQLDTLRLLQELDTESEQKRHKSLWVMALRVRPEGFEPPTIGSMPSQQVVAIPRQNRS